MQAASKFRGLIVATILATCLSLGAAGTAAASDRCGGQQVPTSKISVQLWTFAEYIGFGSDAATIARTEEVFRRLSEMGYRNVEPFTTSGLSGEAYRALLDEYGLRARSRHVDVGNQNEPADIDQIIADNAAIGIKFFGAGGTPGSGDDPVLKTEADWIAYAEYLDELGAQAREAGQRLMVHNHNWEFETTFGDRTAFDILMEHTDRRNVVFQLDIYWATFAGADPVELLEEYGKRIKLFHVKDLRESDRRIEIVGRGVIDFPAIFAAAKNIRYYVVEHDPRFGDPTFDPFEAAEVGFDYLDDVRFGGGKGRHCDDDDHGHGGHHGGHGHDDDDDHGHGHDGHGHGHDGHGPGKGHDKD